MSESDVPVLAGRGRFLAATIGGDSIFKGIFPAPTREPSGSPLLEPVVGVSLACNVSRFAVSSEQGVEWSLKRNCSVTPAQLGGLYASMCVVSLGVAGFFWSQGATLVLPFAVLELLAVGGAFLAYARHAVDSERISLQQDRLVVVQETAGQTKRCEFAREWVRVQPLDDDGQMIEVRGGGQVVKVGRFVRPDLRPMLAREIRLALRGA